MLSLNSNFKAKVVFARGRKFQNFEVLVGNFSRQSIFDGCGCRYHIMTSGVNTTIERNILGSSASMLSLRYQSSGPPLN